MKYNFCLAPWIIKKNNVLLGPKLRVINVPHLDIPKIPPDKLDYLIQNNYIIDQANINQKANSLIPCKLEHRDRKPNWIWASEPLFLKPAFLLKKYLLTSNSSYQWEITKDKETILDNLNSNDPKPFVIRLSHQEPIEKEYILNLYSGLIGKVQLIWVGETIECTHLGPVIHSLDDLENYITATKNWYFSRKLIELGFTELWPSCIYSHLLSHPKRVAKAILKIIKASAETCILIEEAREVCLWTKLKEEKVTEHNFFKTQFWSKGIIRNFQLKQIDFIQKAYLATCRSPCRGIDYLEVNSGKGVTSTDALYSLVGESIERFSAWQSNKTVHNFKQPLEIEQGTVYDIYQFHPFGSKWNDYHLTSSKKPLPLYKVKDETNPSNVCFVPECLIPFPYEATEPQYNVTTSSTAGLATHSSYEKALIKAALELFERDDFYNCFLSQKTGFFLELASIPPQLRAASHNLTALLNCLEASQLRSWCVVYNLNSTLPIVYSFILDQKHSFFSRGAGSGYSLLEATAGAVAEALQLRQQFLEKDESQLSKGHRDWKTPNVVEQIYSYLARFQKLPFSEHPLSFTQYMPKLLLEEIKKNTCIRQKPLLVANLPCPIKKWFTVRVLIPGFTTHQYPSESLGGKKIINPTFTYGIPT